ncbi:MAG TPA: DUF6484 domain-containing protein [Polyangia bacterium]|nr:DUF6484 domain-containing protein [Polyangia bacterium]
MAGKRKPEMARTRNQPAPHVRTREPAVSPPVLGVVVGRLLAGSTPVTPLVDFPGNGGGPLRARATVALDGPTLNRAVVTGQGATLVFENGDPRLPIVTGLVQTDQAATPFQELLVSSPLGAGRGKVEARLDGERVVLEGKHEIVLKCGEASLTLRRDGKVVLRGAYVETYAKGVNRIKGGSVKIN